MKRLALVIAFMALGGALVGCAGSPSSHSPATNGERPAPGGRNGSQTAAGPLVISERPTTMHRVEQQGAHFLSPTRLAIPGILGSSNCPAVPVKLIVQRPHAIRVDLVVGSWSRTRTGLRVRVPHPARVCLDDLHPSPVVIAIDPAQIDVRRPLRVRLYYPEGVIRKYKRPVVVTATPR